MGEDGVNHDDARSNGSDGAADELPINDSIQHLAQLALDISAQDWKDLGKQQQQQQQQQQSLSSKRNLAVAESFQEATERVVSLLLVRIVAVIMGVQQHQEQLQLLEKQEEEHEKNSSKNEQEEAEKDHLKVVQQGVSKKYPSDYSTTSLCRAALRSNESTCCWPIAETGNENESDYNASNANSKKDSMNDVAARITSDVLNQLRNYVKVMLQGYNDLPFHNYQHCYHVVLSANKLLDLMLCVDDSNNGKRRRSKTKTYGLRSDPMALLALMFAALIHDVGHSGVNNRHRVAQLDDELAIQYNDDSIHENHSLYLAFCELLQPKYDALRTCMFPDDVAYRAFRKLVIHVVLSTDLTSPERLQMSASMFQEAYPDYFDNEEEEENEPDNFDEYIPDDDVDNDLNMQDDDDDPRLLDYDDEDYYDKKHELQQQQSAARRSSLGSMPRAVVGGKGPPWSSSAESRRGSMNSVASDITMDSYTRHAKYRQVERLNAQKNAAKYGYGYNTNSNRHINNDDEDNEPRRYSLSSLGEYTEEQSAGDSMLLHARNVPRTAQHSIMRLNSNDSGGGGGGGRGRAYSMGSGANSNKSGTNSNNNNNLNESFSMDSIAAESVGLAQNRQDGKAMTRATKSPTAALRKSRRRRASGGPNAAAKAPPSTNDDDDSLSLTPPSSEDEMDGFIVTGITLSKSVDQGDTSTPAKPAAKAPPQPTTILRRSKSSEEDELFVASMRSQNQQQQPQQPGTASGGFRSKQRPIRSMRRASTGNYDPNRFGRPITGQKIVEESPGDLNDSNKKLDWSFNNNSNNDGSDGDAPANVLPPPGYFRKRLGIRRSMDLSGESIEHYSAQSRRSSCASSAFSDVLDASTEDADAARDGGDNDFDDEPNELRSTVVIEIFLKVSDVAHWFQDWNVMIRYNGGLFRELCAAHAAGRGFDPRSSWFDNQIKAMEQYVLPLADQFCYLGVLEQDVGESFPTTVERNCNRWIEEGYEITQSLTLKQEEDQGHATAKGDE